MQSILDSINALVGKEIREVTIAQVVIRAAITYLFTILLVRLGDKRFLGQTTAFDAVLGFILGSVVSRGINGTAPFVQTLVAACVLVLMHWLFSILIYHGGDGIAGLLEGHAIVLVRDGRIDEKAMKKHHINKADLEGALRLWANVDDMQEVSKATLERSGQISCVLRRKIPRLEETTSSAS